ncbi:MAG: hypothetical protein IPM48_02935 [Saprospiraceae bacterium]|nr:hypothetical protein [Saprospiraceae bacterium]
MTKILGLDLGTNSLGWALIEKDTALIDGGVIIFPRGNNQDQVSGKEESYAQQRTGYRSARRRNFRRKMRIRRIRALLTQSWQCEIYDGIKHSSDPLDLYRIRFEGLNRILDPIELSRILLYFAGKRGFKSSRSMELREGEGNSETGKVKKSIDELHAKLKEGGFMTLGHYYYDLICEHRKGNRLEERILDRYTDREMYKKELHDILSKQLSLNNHLVNEQIILDVMQEIFFQRKLKSCKHLVSNCRFEANKKCMPKSHPLFQEFRFWSAIHNLVWTDYDTGETDSLSEDQKMLAANLYYSKVGVKEAELKKVLGLSRRVVFNSIELKSTTTLIRIKEVLASKFNLFSYDEILSIYHSLLFTEDDQKIKFKEYLLRKFQIDGQTADKLWSMPMEADYSNISHKAALKILEYLKSGYNYSAACDMAGYHHSYNKIETFKDKVEHPKTNEFRNPVVQKSVHICINLVNRIIDKHGKPDVIRIELGRELKKPKEQREKIFNRNRNKEKKRALYLEVLSKVCGYELAYNDSMLKKYELWLELGCDADDFKEFKGFAEFIKASDLEKYRLWLEADRISPYTGKVINLSQLISPEIEIEHIIPFSRSLDDSFMNKTICERQVNKEKGERTPIEYFATKSKADYENFKKRIALFANEAKRDIFLQESLSEDFLSNQLTDSAYIARLAVGKIRECIPNVYTTKGGTTSYLRQAWGLNKLLYDGLDQEMRTFVKNRGDHRHHFIDAVVIASTNPSHIQQLALSKSGKYNNLRFDDILTPWPSFRTEIEDKINSILVVHKYNQKLISKSINKYRYSKRGHLQSTISLRGSLHEDTLYGRINFNDSGTYSYVVRKDVKTLVPKQFDKIVDPSIRNYLNSLIEINSGGWAAVIKEPIYWQGRPLRRVRCINNSRELPMLRRDTKTFVEPGNNFTLAIYEDEITKKRDFDSLNFYKAVSRKLNGEPVINRMYNDKKLKFTVSAYDKFIIYKEHTDEIDWSNQEYLNDNLYHVIKFTGNIIDIGKSCISNIKADYDKPPVKIRWTSNTFKAVKVKLDLLGNIISKEF